MASAGLPDGMFAYQKFRFWYIFEGLEVENCGTLNNHSEYFTATWYILWSFGIFYRFGMLYQEQSGNPWPQPQQESKNFKITTSRSYPPNKSHFIALIWSIFLSRRVCVTTVPPVWKVRPAPIEILCSTRRSILKNESNFFQLVSNLFCVVKRGFVEPCKNVPL
jgi:hypothetical protein